MENKDFANWELTKSLPRKDTTTFGMEIFDDDYIQLASIESRPFSANYKGYSSNAWSWEDIRLFLQEKGFVLEVLYVDDFLKSLKKAHDPDKEYLDWNYRYRETKNMDDFNSSSNTYSTYEEAREAGILEIKDNER